jgi:SAM-dependent methyltransferase
VEDIPPVPSAASCGSKTQLSHVLNEHELRDPTQWWMVEALDTEAPKLELLARALEETLAGRRDEARRALAALCDRLNVDAVPQDMQHLLFAAAIAKRLGGDQAEAINLYLRRYEQPQIDLFNLLAERLPLAAMAGSLANELLAGFLAGHEEATLLDVGIGTGRQEVLLLEAMAAAGTLPKRLTIVGVEPSVASLRRAEEALSATARRLGLALRFHPIARVAEGLQEADWALFQRLPGPLVVNSAFSLHHIGEAGDGTDAREAFFQRLAALAPRGVVLCEPNSNHHRVSALERFRNCWRHFFFVFRLLDELDISPQERNAIKLFFGREVEDILGTLDEAGRHERHEPVGTWLGRLRRNGFALAEGLQNRVHPRGHPAVRVRAERGYLGLEYRGETIVGVVCASPRAGS